MSRPQTPSMRTFWRMHRRGGGAGLGQLGVDLRIRGPLDPAALERALRALQDRHETFRLTFHERDGEAQAQLHPAPAPLHLELETEALPGIARPLDWGTCPVARWSLKSLAADDHLLRLVAPHAMLDGFSVLARLPDELGQCYVQALAGDVDDEPRPGAWEEPLTDLPEDGVQWWREHLRGTPESLEVPSDLPRPPWLSGRTLRVQRQLDAGPRDRLRQAAHEQGASLVDLFLGCWAETLSRQSGASEVVIGVPYARRLAPSDDGLGCALSFVPTRIRLGDRPTVKGLINRVRRERRASRPYRDVPLGAVIKEVTRSDPSRSPLFQSLLSFLPFSSARLRQAGPLQLSVDRRLANPSLQDLALHVEDGPEGSTLYLDAAQELFEARSAERLLDQLCQIAAAVAEDPDQVIREAGRWQPPPFSDGISLAEREQDPLLALDGLAARVGQQPALLSAGEQVTYAELRDRVRRRRAALLKLGVRRGDPVALLQPRSVQAAVTQVALLEMGAPWVALDVSLPLPRIKRLLHLSQPRLVISEAGRLAQALAKDWPVWLIGSEIPSDWPQSAAVLEPALEDEPAWIVFTSGSTGGPRPVLGTRAGLANRLRWGWRTWPAGPDDVACWKTSLAFVDAIAELLEPLLAGTPVVVVPEDASRDVGRLVERLLRWRVSRLTAVPSLLRLLVEHPKAPDLDESLRRIVSSGEPLEPSLVSAVRVVWPRARLLNVYGSTEVSADLTCFDTSVLTPEQLAGGARVPIGRSIQGTGVVLLDEQGAAVPPGAVGEICAAGLCLSAGYLNDADENRARFVTGPSGWRRVFRTGDLARWRHDGTLELRGRRDRQLKLRGQRVQPEEVEEALLALDGVQDAAVCAEERDGRPALAAYVAPILDTDALRAELAQRLPAALRPAQWVALPTLPKTASGKVDRRALAGQRSPRAEVTITAPRDELERELLAACQRILGVELAGVSSDFVTQGADSIDVMRLVVELEVKHGTRTPSPVEILARPTVAALAAALRAPHVGPQERVFPLRLGAPERAPLILCHGHWGGLGPLAGLVPRLPPERTVLGLRYDDPAPLPTTLEELAELHLPGLLEAAPRGPYLLMGYSWGGLLAYELAYQLLQRGQQVALLALGDTMRGPHPGRGSSWLNYQRKRLARIAQLPLRRASARFLAAVFRDARRLVTSADGPDVDSPEGRREHLLGLARRYARAPLPIAIDLIVAEESVHDNQEESWRRVAGGGLRTWAAPGTHTSMGREPHAAKLAAVVCQLLEQVEEPVGYRWEVPAAWREGRSGEGYSPQA